MLVNKANVKSLFSSLSTEFNSAFGAAPVTWPKIAMKIPSSGESNFYGWLGAFPKMRRWIGAKHVKTLKAASLEIKNQDFEATIEVQRNDIEDDQTGMYLTQAKMAGFSAAQLPDEIVYEVVNAGFSARCYDGQYFFDTDHPTDVGLVSNKSTAPLSNATKAIAAAGYGAARLAMRSIKDDDGRSMNITPSVLLVGNALEDVARALLTNEFFSDGAENLYKGSAELVVDPRITSDTAWFLLDTTKPIKPFIYQERKAPDFVSQVSLDADDVFNMKVLKFGAEARGAAGYGFWQTAHGSTGTGAK